MMLTVRAMQPQDLEAVLQVQAQSYPPAMNEPREVLARRLSDCPDTAWVLSRDGQVQAYLVGYRSCVGQVSPLGADFAHRAQPDVLYLHDLALGVGVRGQGAASLLLAEARQWAHRWGLAAMTLVSVNDTVPFWCKHGFEVMGVSPEGQAALDTYVGRAVYMLARCMPE